MSGVKCPDCGLYNPDSAERCDCGAYLLGGARRTVPAESSPVQQVGVFGAVLQLAAIVAWAYLMVAFDVTTAVSSSDDRVANLHLLAIQQNGVVIAAAVFVAGAVFVAVGLLQRKP